MCWTLKMLVTLTEERETAWVRFCKAVHPNAKKHWEHHYNRLANAVRWLEARHNEE